MHSIAAVLDIINSSNLLGYVTAQTSVEEWKIQLSIFFFEIQNMNTYNKPYIEFNHRMLALNEKRFE